jgi:hypothetical protein
MTVEQSHFEQFTPTQIFLLRTKLVTFAEKIGLPTGLCVDGLE